MRCGAGAFGDLIDDPAAYSACNPGLDLANAGAGEFPADVVAAFDDSVGKFGVGGSELSVAICIRPPADIACSGLPHVR
jgi:hypothetical protein